MILNEVFEAVVEPTLVQPTFVTDHPLEISPLAKPHRSKPGCVERWELFIAGALCRRPFAVLLLTVNMPCVAQRADIERSGAGAHSCQLIHWKGSRLSAPDDKRG